MQNAGLNRSYRLVWSDLHQSFIAVAEFARSRGKGSSKAAVVLASAGLAGVMGMAGLAQAADLPTGGAIVAGSGSITQSGSTMTVTQTTGKMAADWQSFNIGAGNTVNFVQPSTSSVALNRVLGADVSVIQGALNANGQVFLVNPNGVLFTPTAQVNVGSLVASTLALSTADFMAGNYQFDSSSRNTDEGSAIINQGNITAMGDGAGGGTIALIAAKITNTGTLTATGGNVLLGAGSKVTLDMGGPVKLEVEQGALNTLIEQGGAIRADDGLVYLTAKAAGELAASVIQSSGLIEASSLRSEGGAIILEADTIHLQAGSRTLATGATGGGKVLVGGDWQGSGTLRQATQVTLDAGARIDASATEAGNGGKVVLWSDVHSTQSQTRAYGDIAAKGGSQGGNGGQIETSGHWLDVAGITANASASSGTGGEWLLDPYNVTIAGSGASGTVYATPFTPSADSTILASSVATSLNGGTSVTITTGTAGVSLGNISVTANIAKTAGGDATLTLKAHNAIEINAGVSITSTAGALNVVLNSDSDATNGGYIWLGKGNTTSSQSATTITTNGGALTLSGGTDITTGYAQGAAAGTSNGIVLDTANISTGGGNIVVRGKSGTTGVSFASSDVASSSNTDGIRLHGSNLIDSGTGTIQFTGIAQGTSGSSNGIETSQTGYSRITSAASSTTAINMTGDATLGTSGNGWGTFLWGTNTSGIVLAATGANGGIGLVGQGRNQTTGGGVHLEPNAFVLATSGPIAITGTKGAISTYEDIVINSSVGYVATLPAGFGVASPVTASTSNITLTADSLSANRVFGGGTFSGSAVQSSGVLTIAPRTTGKAMAVQTANPGASTFWINPTSMFGASGLFKTGFSKLVFGSSTTGDITLNNYSFDNDTELNTSGNAVLGAVTIANGKALTVNMAGNGSITDTGAMAVANLNLNGSTSAVMLDSTTNAIGTVAGTVASLNLVNGAALTVGSVGGTNGITATGDVSITTQSGDLTLTKNISTTATSATAITLNAGKTSSAGTATGGNLVISGSPVLSTGTGGRVTLYSGSVSSSTGLTALVGSGSGNFRYNSDESSTGYNATTAALGSGVYGIYREQPKFTVTADDVSKTYDGLTFSGGTGVTTGSLVNGDTSALAVGALTYGGTAQGAKNAGTYAIALSGLSSDLGYGYTYVNGALTVSKAPLTVTANATSKTYGDADPSLTYQVTTGSLVGSDSLTGALTRIAGESVGSYTINASALANGNYLITANNGSLAISQRAITVTADAKNKTYGDADPSLTYQVTTGSLVGSDSLTGALTRTAGENVGNYTINASALANGNYLITANNGSLAINQRSITVTADAKSKVAGDADPSLTYQVTTGSLVGSDSLGALTRAAGEAAGNYTINASALANGNYLITATDGTLTISAVPGNANSASASVEQAAIALATQAASQSASGGESSTSGGALAFNTALNPIGFLNPTGAETSSGANTNGGQSISGGLALVDVASAPPSGQGGSTSNTGGFLTVFVVSGGINTGGDDTQPTTTRVTR